MGEGDAVPNDEQPTRRVDADNYPTRAGLSAGRQVFGRYGLRALLGQGGMGVVWRAHDEKLDRDVALKFLLPAVAADPEAMRDLLRETKRCLELTDRNIVRVYDFVEGDGLAAIAMEFVQGENLARRKATAAAGCLRVDEIAPLVAQLCSALDFAHLRARVVHRDLKPANLLVTADGELKVMDFGISRSLAETKTRLTGRMDDSSGTLPYMSPQQHQGKSPTAADDIYALGATLYDLLTGKPPFYTGNIAYQVFEEKPAPLAERRTELGRSGPPIPKDWEQVILACLEKEPGKRPKSAGEVAARLQLGPAARLQPGPAPVAPPATKDTQGANDKDARAGVVASVRQGPAEGGAGKKSRLPLVLGLIAIIALAILNGRSWLRDKPADAGPAPVVVPPVKAPVVKTGRLTVKVGGPAQYSLWVDGRESGSPAADGSYELPAEKELALVVKAGGYFDASRRITLVAGGKDSWTPELRKLHGPEAGQPYENTLGQKFVPVPGTHVLFGVWDTRNRDYNDFLHATQRFWRVTPTAGPEHPAVFVSWEDAQAFCAWLTNKEQALGVLGPDQKYRLPTDAEWSVAAGLSENPDGSPESKNGKIKGVFPWGTAWPPPPGAGNFADESAKRSGTRNGTIIVGYDDGYPATSPVGSFSANRFGLYDMSGNVWQWCEDYYNGRDGERALRGGSNDSVDANSLLSSHRYSYPAAGIRDFIGFRPVIALGGAPLDPGAGGTAPGSGPKFDQAWTVPGLDLKMQPISPGSFAMGTQSGDDSLDERPVTIVMVKRFFWLGATEVTQRQWYAVMGFNPSYHKGGDLPVEMVSWGDAMEFCRKVTERERAAGRLPEGYAYTLPTEAQWEYACRAGSTGDFAGNLDAMGWYADNSGHQTHPVGRKQANAWGLFDMHGNVNEWCADLYGNYPGGSVINPTGATTGSRRVYRGGSYASRSTDCRSAARHEESAASDHLLGLRLALTPLGVDQTPNF